jgi:xanthosine utilization system XapX-like protein
VTFSAPSPAPPWLGLTGLLGIVFGELAVTALRDLLTRRRPVGRTRPGDSA